MAKAKVKKSTRIKAQVKSKSKSNVKVKAKAKKTPAKKKTATQSKTKVKVKQTSLVNVISPLDNRLIIQLESGDRVTPGGLIIPDTSAVSGQQKGKVLAVGRGRRDEKGKTHPMDVQVGDRVLLSDYAGDNIEILGQKVRILRETDILGILED